MRNVTKSEYIPTNNEWDKISEDFKEFRYATAPYANGEIIFREYINRKYGLSVVGRHWRFEYKSETQHILVFDCFLMAFNHSSDADCETAAAGEGAYQLYFRRKFFPAQFYHIEHISTCDLDFLEKNNGFLNQAFRVATTATKTPLPKIRDIHITYLGFIKNPSPPTKFPYDEQLRSIFAREGFFVGNCLKSLCGSKKCYITAFSNCGYAHRNKVDGDIIPFAV